MKPAEEAARERWFDVIGPVCRICGLDENQAMLQLHHVVAKSWLKRQNLRHLLWEPANRLVLCTDCHEAHENASRRLTYTDLSEDNLAFVAELEGLVPPVPIRGHMRRYPGYRIEEEAA